MSEQRSSNERVSDNLTRLRDLAKQLHKRAPFGMTNIDGHTAEYAAQELELRRGEVGRLRAAAAEAEEQIGMLAPVLLSRTRQMLREALAGAADEPSGSNSTTSAQVARPVDLRLIEEQAEQGVWAEHECPAFYACACILAEFRPTDKTKL